MVALERATYFCQEQDTFSIKNHDTEQMRQMHKPFVVICWPSLIKAKHVRDCNVDANFHTLCAAYCYQLHR